MVLPKGLARFNRVATNRINKYVVGWAPGFGMLVHKGRKSGKEYRTPLNVFRTRTLRINRIVKALESRDYAALDEAARKVR